MLYGIAAATSALLLAALLTALLQAPLLRAGLVDRRRVRPVPLAGGAAVVLATCAVAGAGEWTGVAPLGEGTGALLLAAGCVAVLGAVADIWRLRTRFVAVGTAVAAALVVPYGETGTAAGVAAVGWIVGVTLAFRGLDHADGLAGTVGVVTAFGAGMCASAEALDGQAVLLCVLAAALTGFLMHNWPPARAGLGASGSLFTGFLLASAGVLVRSGGGHAFASTTAVLFGLGAAAVADTVLVLLSRLRSGRPPLRDGPDHLAHRLRRLGVTPSGAVVLIGAGASACVAVAVLIHTGWLGAGAALWAAGGALTAVLGLLRVSPYGGREARTSARLDCSSTAVRNTAVRNTAVRRPQDTRAGGVSPAPTRAGATRAAAVGAGSTPAGVTRAGMRAGARPYDPLAAGAPGSPVPSAGAPGSPARSAGAGVTAGLVRSAEASVTQRSTPLAPHARVTRSTPIPPPPRPTPRQKPSSTSPCV